MVYNIDILNGALNMDVYNMYVASLTQVYGKLEMTNESNLIFTVEIKWYQGSAADVTAGIFFVAAWTFYEGADVVFSTGNTANVTNYLTIGAHDASFGNLRVGGLFKNTGNYVKARDIKTSSGTLRTEGFYTVIPGFGGAVENIDHIIGGPFTIESGATYALESCNVSVGGEFDLQGNLYISDDAEVVIHGGLNFPAGGALYIEGGSLVAGHPEPVPPDWTNINGSLNMTEGLFELTNNHPRFNLTATTDISGGIIRTGGSFEAEFAGVFQPTGGMVELTGNSSSAFEFNCANGNHFHDLLINRAAPTSVYLPVDLIIKNDLIIQNGQFSMHPGGGDLFVGGNWINNVGANGFLPLETTVVFNGSTAQTCSAEEFYKLSLNKPEGKVTFSSLTTCEIFDWQSGGLIVDGGAFTAYSLEQCGVRGSYTVTSEGTINLFQDKIKKVDLYAEIKILSGTMNIYGGLPGSGSHWPAESNASLYMSGGVLDIKDQHIYMVSTGTFPNNVFGGTIRTSKGYSGERADFQPSGGTFEFYGPDNAFILQSNGSTLHNVLINKDLGSATKETPSGNEPNSRIGRSGSKSYKIDLHSDITLTNDLEIASGTMNINNFVATVEGNATINHGSKLQLQGYGTLVMVNNGVLSVMEGAELQLSGDGEYYTKITSAAGLYSLNVESGGLIGAEYAIFEFMDVNGVNIKPGAIVDPYKSFHSCIFRHGHISGRLLTLNNDQAITINNAKFPNVMGNFNVSKLHNTGVVTLMNYSGAFSGSAFEQDDHNRIHWTGELSPMINLNGITIHPWQDMCFEAEETIVVGGEAPFEAMQASNVSLVAGNCIVMLPGTHAHHGSSLRAWVSENGYCSNLPLPMLAIIEEKPLPEEEIIVEFSVMGNLIKTYPNPTTGDFTMELYGFDESEKLLVQIFTMQGILLSAQEMPASSRYNMSLKDRQPGIYLIRVVQGGSLGVGRIVKQ